MVYKINSGVRESDSIFYGEKQPPSGDVPQKIFEDIVRYSARFCCDVAILNINIDALDIDKITQQHCKQILRWQFMIRDNILPIANIVAKIRETQVWKVLESVDQLLGIRRNKPAQFFTWKPGGGLRKEETLHDAVIRHVKKEVRQLEGLPYRQGYLLDLHFEDSSIAGTSTHTPALAVYLRLNLTSRKLELFRGELARKRWHAAVEVLEGEYDVYTKTVLLLSIFDIMLRNFAGIYS